MSTMKSNIDRFKILLSGLRLTSSSGLLPVTVQHKMLGENKKQSITSIITIMKYHREKLLIFEAVSHMYMFFKISQLWDWGIQTCNDSSLHNLTIFILNSLSKGLENSSLMRGQRRNQFQAKEAKNECIPETQSLLLWTF